ncbi:MAG TPA: hypothetical protein DDZ51_23380 [Planctomycetaceae bacterium]|nr:hypothetical protein [Planctomycetaceae bacterium]
MELKKTTSIFLTVACGIAIGALGLWFLQFAWEKVQEHDASPQRANVKNQLMRRKAVAMEDALQAILGGNLSRVNAAAVRMKQSARTIDGFLATEVYKTHGDDFHGSIEDLITATAANDRDGAKEAILRLEKSCIECHYLINQPE